MGGESGFQVYMRIAKEFQIDILQCLHNFV